MTLRGSDGDLFRATGFASDDGEASEALAQMVWSAHMRMLKVPEGSKLAHND